MPCEIRTLFAAHLTVHTDRHHIMAGGRVIQLHSAEEWASTKNKKAGFGKNAVVVDFSATWCGPCKMISPVFEKLSTQFPAITFVKIDVDELQVVTFTLRLDLAVDRFVPCKAVDGMGGAWEQLAVNASCVRWFRCTGLAAAGSVAGDAWHAWPGKLHSMGITRKNSTTTAHQAVVLCDGKQTLCFQQHWLGS